MKTKTIDLCGKQVTLAYCYATEIGFKIMTGEEAIDFIVQAIRDINQEPKVKPDIQKTIFLVLSAITSYYESKGVEPPIHDSDLIYHASPEEPYNALATVIQLYTEFYDIPVGEPKDKEEDKKEAEKNV